MTALIVGLLAALGIGGGFVIANNSGSSGGGAAVVQFTGEKQDYIANVNPDFSLISALTDTNQYQPSIADDGSFFKEYQASALQRHLLASDSIYGDPEEDLRNGIIHGEQIDNTDYYATLNLLKGINSFFITSLQGSVVNGEGLVQVMDTPQSFLLTSSDLYAQNSRYKTFRKDDAVLYSSDNQTAFYHYNAVHLGGSTLGLSVADFGHWDEKAWTENSGNKQLVMHNNKTFFFYDERFAYKNMYYKNTATMQGNVFVSVLGNNESVDGCYNLQTGSISMDLNLASKKITNGQVIMDNPAYQAEYNVSGFTGSIVGSIFLIDGTWQTGAAPQEGDMRGGVGKLLIGADGLEMVGNFARQIKYEGWVDSEGHPYYEPGKADYTFGAKETN